MLREVFDGFIMAGFSVFVLFILVVLPVMVFGPDFETRYIPVISEMSATSIEGDFIPKDVTEGVIINGTAWYQLTFDKARVCTPVKDLFSWFVVLPDGRKQRVNLVTYWKEDPETGKYTVYVQVDELKNFPFSSQILVVSHNCHPLWVSRTRINIPISSREVKYML